MQISGLQPTQAAQSLSGAGRTPAAGRSAPTAATGGIQVADELDLSAEAQSISQTQAANQTASTDIRWEKVNALREAIANGSFESEQRLSGTVDKILDAYA